MKETEPYVLPSERYSAAESGHDSDTYTVNLNICLKKKTCPYLTNGFSSDADRWLKRIYCDSNDGYRWCLLFRRMVDNLAVSKAIAPNGNIEP
ncbi:MAG TPA: hypothetical protein PLG43_13000, partial [Spirochaetia bacterium]|nr:hypothetical protein [Spirochaetia bacterium]